MFTPRVRSLVEAVRRFVRARRRPLAAVCVAGCVAFSLHAVRPASPERDPVVVAAHDLRAGSTLAESDLSVLHVAGGTVPDGAVASKGAVSGRVLASPLRSGEPVTDVRVVHPGLLKGYPPGSALAPVRVADAATVTGIRVGDVVDVVAADPSARRAPTVVARRARVATLARSSSERDADGAMLTVAVPERTALALAGAATTSRLSILPVL